jgi:hypothetical protein
MKLLVKSVHFKNGDSVDTEIGYYNSVNMVFNDKLCLKDYNVTFEQNVITVSEINKELTTIEEYWVLYVIPDESILKLFGILTTNNIEDESEDIIDEVEYESDNSEDDYNF